MVHDLNFAIKLAKKTLKNQFSRISTGTNTGMELLFVVANLASTRTKIRTEFFICLLGEERKKKEIPVFNKSI